MTEAGSIQVRRDNGIVPPFTDPTFQEIDRDTRHHLRLLVLELDEVLGKVVRPGFDSDHLSRYPRTLYGYVMNAFAFVDLLSLYSDRAAGRHRSNQTRRMVGLLHTEFGASRSASRVAIKMWRHTLMHGGNPRNLHNAETGEWFSWLLHWGEPWIPASDNLTLHENPPLSVIQVGLTTMVRELERVGARLFDSWANDPDAQRGVVAAEREITQW